MLNSSWLLGEKVYYTYQIVKYLTLDVSRCRVRALLSQAARGCSIIPRIKALDRISDDTKASLSLEASIVPSSKSAMQLGLGIAAFEAAVNTPWRKMKKIASETKV